MNFRKKYLLLLFIFFLTTFFASQLSLASSDTDTSLLAHYLFDGDLSDQSSNFPDGEVTADRINNEGGSIRYADGMRGQAAVFDGQSGILLPEALITDNSYSVALWVNPVQITDFTTTFFAGVFRDDAYQSWVSIVPNGPVGSTMVWSGNDPWYDAPSNHTISVNQWSHLAFTVGDGKIKVYLNGEEEFSGSNFPEIFKNAEDAVFALGVNYWDPPFQGMMDDLRIYDKAISPELVAELAEGAPELPEAPEEFIYRPPQFDAVSVHDPMIARVEDGRFYVFGSHLASAYSDDLIEWYQLTAGWSASNSLIPNPAEELREAMEWPEPDNAESTWAKSVIKLNDKYHMYFSTSTWGATRSAIALATAEDIEGPYKYQDFVIRSYNPGEENIEGVPHDPNIHPNAIDPYVFFDAEDNLWMIYGSYAGGIFMLEMDSETGMPKPDQGYGKKISGGNHAAMEGAYVIYHPETEYYYYMISFGSLAPDDGYNIRLARSKNPDGPYYDPTGRDMISANPRIGKSYEPYGARIIGNFAFLESGIGYLSPGHNSAYYDDENGKMYAIFHARFPGAGHMHNVRVHQILINSEGWPVIAPHRYTGESLASYTEDEIIGTYQYINHGKSITADLNRSVNIELSAEGQIVGEGIKGEWEMTGENTINLSINGDIYHGVVLKQWDEGLKKDVMTFTALSNEGLAIWGSSIE
ncbi:LamG-like jellyroll fold domain-containing protein [Natronospora cellulosivora (SeqCode)]